MLKFSDLKVDFKSFEKSLNFFMKLFPNTYLPLLIMYLSREGLLKVKSDVDENDPHVLFRISANEIIEFMGITDQTIKKSNSIADLTASLLGIDFSNDTWQNKYDIVCLGACGNMIERLFENKSLLCSLVIDGIDNKDFVKVKEILCANSSQPDEPAAFWLYCELLMSAFPTISSDNDFRSEFYYTKMFDSFIDRQQRVSNNRLYKQPTELTRIILSQYKGGSVYNPFAGLASYHIEMSHGLRENVGGIDDLNFSNFDDFYEAHNSLGGNYYAEEIDELTWAIGKLRLLFYHMDSPNYILGDSTKGFSGKVDNVICTPPFNYKVINEYGGKENADHFVIRRGLEMLKDDGMMALVVPMSFLNRKDTIDIRKELVSKHWLSDVVYLPENVFSTTGISTAILFVYKNSHYYVKFVDATNMVANKNGYTKILKVDSISNLIEHDEHPMERYPLVDPVFKFGGLDSIQDLTPQDFNSCITLEEYDTVVNNDYNLSPSCYFSSHIDIPEGYKMETLGNLISRKVFPKATKEGTQIIVSTSDLSKDFNFPYIERASLAAGIAKPNFELLEIDKKALLISSIGELRPSIIGPSYGDVYISPNIFAFYLDDNKIVPEYLVGELSKDYVKEQLRLMMMGSVIHRINLNDALKLQILVPVDKDFLKREEEIVQERKNEYFEKIGIELSDLKDRRHDEYVKMLRQRKHRLLQIMNEFAPAFAQLNKCRIKQGGVLHDNDIAAARTGETVGSYFDKLNNIVSKVEDLITNLVNKDTWGESEDIDIDDFVDQIPQSHFSNKYEIQVYHDRDCEIWEEGEIANLNDSRIVKMDKDSLSTLFENIIANASKWGFNEDVRRDFLIRITVSDGMVDNQKAVRISVANNGSPIHESVDRSRFFEWGYGTGTGIGTSQLKDIVEHYGGSIKLNEFPDDSAGFFTEYEIVLPLIDND